MTTATFIEVRYHNSLFLTTPTTSYEFDESEETFTPTQADLTVDPDDEHTAVFTDPREVDPTLYPGVDLALKRQFQIEVDRPPTAYIPDDPVPEYFARYQELGGDVVDNLDAYRYFYDLFYLLTQNRVGGDCPMPSELGFHGFDFAFAIYTVMELKRKYDPEMFNIFFESIDSVHAYS